LTKLFGISIIALLVIFHPELREGLARLGRRHIFGTVLKEEELEYVLKEITKAVQNIANNNMGALIAIEKNDPLKAYIEKGAIIDARASSDLIEAIFTPNNPLHDGGLVVQNGRLVAAGCLFPLNQDQDLSRVFGTRHRAALGLSEETDAIIIIVSEERKDVSLVYRGKLYKDLSPEELFLKIKEIIKLERDYA
jgi:diadenylate cyclase